MDNLAQKLHDLETVLRGMDGVTIAFSGGVDSAFLLAFAHETLGDKAIAVTIDSQLHDSAERAEAISLAERIGARHHILSIDALALPEVAHNEPDRCYHCKRNLFGTLREWAATNGTGPVVDGTNADDSADDRAGMRALDELAIVSPLRVAGLTKADIREASRRMGLPTHDKPAYACLATRIPFHVALTDEALRMVERAEAALTALGFVQRRVRHHGDIARIELPPSDIERAAQLAPQIAQAVRACGFAYAALDLDGYRTGSMNATKKGSASVGG